MIHALLSGGVKVLKAHLMKGEVLVSRVQDRLPKMSHVQRFTGLSNTQQEQVDSRVQQILYWTHPRPDEEESEETLPLIHPPTGRSTSKWSHPIPGGITSHYQTVSMKKFLHHQRDGEASKKSQSQTKDLSRARVEMSAAAPWLGSSLLVRIKILFWPNLPRLTRWGDDREEDILGRTTTRLYQTRQT